MQYFLMTQKIFSGWNFEKMGNFEIKNT